MLDARNKELRAELELRQLRQYGHWRSISLDDFIAAIKNRPNPPRVAVLYQRDDPEAWNLASLMFVGFSQAGWPLADVIRPIPQGSDPRLPSALDIGAQPAGVTIVIRRLEKTSAKYPEAINALRDALLKPLRQLSMGTDPKLSADEIRVVVGPKSDTLPIPLSDLTPPK